MPTLITRAREIVSAVSDDFFGDDTILYYLNKTQQKIVSFGVQKEKVTGTTLRALDAVRSIDEITLSAGTAVNDYYEVDEAFPSDLNDFYYLKYNDSTPLKEITHDKLYLLHLGNIIPTEYESYFQVTDKTFKLFLYENPDEDVLNIQYIKNPTPLTDSDEELTDLPVQLENAVIYGAGMMMVGQESVKDPEGNIQPISQIYNDELQNGLY